MDEVKDLMFIDTFWRQMCPFFGGYEFIYILLDIITIIVMFKLMFAIPRLVLEGWKK